MSPTPKRPRELNQLAKFVVEVATGQIDLPNKSSAGKKPSAAAGGEVAVKGSLKDGLLKAKLTLGKDSWEFEDSISRTAKGELVIPGFGRWRKVGSKEWRQANLASGRKPQEEVKDRLPLKDLADALPGKKFSLSDGRKDRAKPLGVLEIKKIDRTAVEAMYTSTSGKNPREVKGVLQGTTMALSLQGKGLDLFAVFHKEGKAWGAKGLFGRKDAPIKAMIHFAEVGNKK